MYIYRPVRPDNSEGATSTSWGTQGCRSRSNVLPRPTSTDAERRSPCWQSVTSSDTAHCYRIQMLIFVLSFRDETCNERTFGPLTIRPHGHVITSGTSTQFGDATSQKTNLNPLEPLGPKTGLEALDNRCS